MNRCVKKWCNWRCSEKTRKYWGWSKINTLLPALLLSSAPWHYCNTNYFTPLHYIGTANTHTNTNTDANTNTNTHINKNTHSFCFLALALLEHHFTPLHYIVTIEQSLFVLSLYTSYCCLPYVSSTFTLKWWWWQWWWWWRRTFERERVKSKWGWCWYICDDDRHPWIRNPTSK